MLTSRWSLSARRRVDGGVRRLMSLGVQPTDLSEERTAKVALTLASLMLGFFAGAWTLAYFLLGLAAAAAVPLIYQATLLLAFGHFALTKHFAAFRFVSLSLLLLAPITLQFVLGGFHSSSGVALWSFVAPLGAIVAYGARDSLRWFVAYLVLVSASTAADASEITSQVHVPTATVATFFVANVSGVSIVIYLLMRYFVRERAQAMTAIEEQQVLLAEEQRKSEELLLNILPAPVAQRLKQHDGIIADRLPDVSVLFADIVGFTELSQRRPPEIVVGMLNRLFTAFDELADLWGLEKIKTIGDAYMVAGGVTVQHPGHVGAIAHMALAMQREAQRQNAAEGFTLDLRIGIDVGPVVAGVIGRRKFAYDMWGDTVNTASRMESTGSAGTIQISGAAYERLRSEFQFERREGVTVKGKGELTTYILLGERSAHGVEAVTKKWKG